MTKFQNPIILKSAGESPNHAFVSFIATTYIVCSTASIVMKEQMKRKAYVARSRMDIFSGLSTFPQSAMAQVQISMEL